MSEEVVEKELCSVMLNFSHGGGEVGGEAIMSWLGPGGWVVVLWCVVLPLIMTQKWRVLGGINKSTSGDHYTCRCVEHRAPCAMNRRRTIQPGPFLDHYHWEC